jgi:L-alanine-DL-glutamate epimerase-like enolase superfamily enzyme
MEIGQIDAIPVEVPLTPLEKGGIGPYRTNHNTFDSIERILVRVETDEGTVGWGEMRVFLSPAVTVAVIEDGIAPIVTGESPFAVESLRRQIFIEYTNIDMFFAPVEIACWDVVGQVTGRPIFELLGGWAAPAQTNRVWRTEEHDVADGTVPAAYCLGILPPAETAAKAESVASEGYEVLKMKAGQDWRVDVDRILAIQEAIGDDLALRLDPNQGWTPGEALHVARSLADAGVRMQYLEQPIGVNMHDELAKLRDRGGQPIAPNEDTYITDNVRHLVESNSMDAAVLDMTPAGGLSGLRQQALCLENAGIPATHHCAFDLGVRTAAIVHAVYGIPGLSLPPDTIYYGWKRDVLETPLTLEDGAFLVPDGPGLGVSLDADIVDEYRID